MQTGVEVTFEFPLTLGLWGSFSLENASLHEIELSIETGFERKIVSFNAGYALGIVPEDDETEFGHILYAGIEVDIPYLNPEVLMEYDTSGDEGIYASVSIGQGFDLAKDIMLEFAQTLGMNFSAKGEHWGSSSVTGLSHLDFVVAIVATTGKFTISPFAMLSIPLHDALKEQFNNSVAGVAGITVTF